LHASSGVSTSAASLIVTLTQLGYALSLLLVVPLGDIFERRRLIVMTAAVSALMLVAVALFAGIPLHAPDQLFVRGSQCGSPTGSYPIRPAWSGLKDVAGWWEWS